MITIEQYFRWPGHEPKLKPHEQHHTDTATDLLLRVNTMLADLGWAYPIDPDTGCSISGNLGGAGDGGFRLLASTTGATWSQHKRAHAVDVYDPGNRLDNLLTDEILENYGLYREHPISTLGWCHLQDLPPGSKKRTFYP